MRAERYTIGVAIMGIAIVALGVLADRPLLFVAGVPCAAWLFSRQMAAFRAIRAVDDSLELDVTAARTTVSVEEDLRVVVSAHLDTPAPASLEITVPLPVGATGASLADRTVSVAPGERETATAFVCSFPTAGRFAFPTPEVDVIPMDGLFAETLSTGDPLTVRVEPRAPTDLHVGRGGDALALSYGEHPAGRGGGGLTPDELRQYQPGDAADRIDWRATARHDGLFVREFEAETDRRTVLVVDHRARTNLGRAGETLFEYAREAALAFVDGAETLSDPLGCWTVGDDGITGRFPATSSSSGYDQIRTHLRALTPTDDRPDVESVSTTADGLQNGPSADSGTSTSTSGRPGTPARGSGSRVATGGMGTAVMRPSEAAVRLNHLGESESPFASKLRPFFGSRDAYVQRLKGDALFAAVERVRADASGATLSVIVTDDRDRDQLRETVQIATRGGGAAFVFVAPRVLFDDDGLVGLERGYDQYVDFEKFRQSLDRLPRVTAFEVGPGDRLDTLLTARRRH